MNIRKSVSNDIKGIVDVHCSAFKVFFTELGRNFLKLYYFSYNKESRVVLREVEKAGEVVGFSSATSLSSGFNIRLVKNAFLWYVLKGCMIALTKHEAMVIWL